MMKGSKRGRNKFKPVRDGRGSKNDRRMEEIVDTAGKELGPDTRARVDARKGGPNDWQWYAQNPELVRNYASFPFGVALGTPLYTGLSQIDASAVPGVMRIQFMPMIGSMVQDSTSPINIASRNIYSFVRHANSGHANYDAPDLMMYLLAMDSVYMYHAFLKRLLGVLMAYTPVNRYYPRALVTAMDVDFNDIQQHIVDLRGYINQYAVKIGSMCVPNSMSYMARHSWMCSGVYVDSGAVKAQTYLYVPKYFYQLTLKSPDSGGDVPTSLDLAMLGYSNFKRLVSFGDALMEPILSNEDMNIMSGDVLKAFGPEGVVKVAGVPENYIVLPEYNQEVLSQIENATLLPVSPFNVADHRFWITQDVTVGGGYIKYAHEQSLATSINTSIHQDNPKWSGALLGWIAPYSTSKRILNFHHDNVTPEEVIVATRLTNIIKGLTSQGNDFFLFRGNDDSTNTVVLHKWVDVPSAGSEIALSATMYYYVMRDGQRFLTSREYTADTTVVANDTNTITNMVSMTEVADTLGRISNFDWAPSTLLGTILIGNSSGTLSVLNGQISGVPLMDVDNYTIIDVDNLRNMSLTSLLSEFSVPQMGAFATKI